MEDNAWVGSATYTVGDFKQLIKDLPDEMPVVIDDGAWWCVIENVEKQTFDYEGDKEPVFALVSGEAYSKP